MKEKVPKPIKKIDSSYEEKFIKAKEKAHSLFLELGVLDKENRILDKSKIFEVFNEYKKGLRGSGMLELFFTVISDMKVIDSQIIDGVEKMREIPLLSLPANLNEFLYGNFEDGLFYPSDLIQPKKFRLKLTRFPITLKDGIRTNVGELKISKFLRDAFVAEGADGLLTYYNTEKSKRETLTLRELDKKLFNSSDSSLNNFSGVTFNQILNELPNLFQNDVLSIDNFKIISKGEAYKNYGLQEKTFSKKGKSTFRFFTADDGTCGNYYFGKSHVVGTDIEINEQLRTAQLDGQTGAVISNSFGKKTILFTFPIGKSEYMDNLVNEKIREYSEKEGKSVTKKYLSRNGKIQVGADRMKEIMVPYSVEDYIGDNLKNLDPYMKNKILSIAGDYSFITTKLREKLGPLNLKIAFKPWKDQVLLGSILAYLNNEKEIISFLDTYRDSGLSTITSVLRGGFEMSRKILDIGEKLPTESANAIFTKYAELVNITKNIEDFIKTEFSEDIAQNQDIVEQVKDKILHKGVAILNLFHERIDTFDENETPNAVEVIEQELSQISADAIATLSTFKFARKNNFPLSLEDIKNSEFRQRNIEDISDKEREEMIRIYRENYSDNPAVAEKLIHQFKQAFKESDNNTFYTYRLRGKLNAFVRFEKREDGKFASALNVDKQAQGYSLGEAMMEQALTQESEKNILYAEANLAEWNTARYMELGFIATKENTKYNVPAVNIKWDRHLNENYLSKNLSEKDIFAKKSPNKNILIEDYGRLSDFDRSRLGHYVMTRALFNKEENKYYIVLEENQEKNA